MASALLVVSSGAVDVATGQDSIDYSPDIGVELGAVRMNDEDIATDDLAGGVLVRDLGVLPGASDVIAYDVLPGNEELLAFDIPTALPGGLTVMPGDVARYDGNTYTLEFDASAQGIPPGVRTDAVGTTATGDLLLSFDTTVELGALTAVDEDVVEFTGLSFSAFFDGSAAGVAPELDVDAVHYRSDDDHLLLSFDGSGIVGGIAFDDEDVLEYDRVGQSWTMAYDGSAEHGDWVAADLDALHVGPSCQNGTIDPGEQCGENGLPSCADDFLCVQCQCRQRGDCALNGGGVDLFDVLAQIDILLGRTSPTAIQQIICDDDCDFQIDLFDVLTGIDVVLGRRTLPLLCPVS